MARINTIKGRECVYTKKVWYLIDVHQKNSNFLPSACYVFDSSRFVNFPKVCLYFFFLSPLAHSTHPLCHCFLTCLHLESTPTDVLLASRCPVYMFSSHTVLSTLWRGYGIKASSLSVQTVRSDAEEWLKERFSVPLTMWQERPFLFDIGS